MLFMRDGTLLVTVGDRDRFCCDGSENTSQRMKAQALDNDYGKILRVRDDGSIAPETLSWASRRVAANLHLLS